MRVLLSRSFQNLGVGFEHRDLGVVRFRAQSFVPALGRSRFPDPSGRMRRVDLPSPLRSSGCAGSDFRIMVHPDPWEDLESRTPNLVP